MVLFDVRQARLTHVKILLGVAFLKICFVFFVGRKCKAYFVRRVFITYDKHRHMHSTRREITKP
jgi:hypothetical protein